MSRSQKNKSMMSSSPNIKKRKLDCDGTKNEEQHKNETKMSSSPNIKKRKLQYSQKKIKFGNQKDQTQYSKITAILNESINCGDNNYPSIPETIIEEIGEFATGLILQCNNKNCDGVIHYLREKNFNSKYKYNNDYHLYDYKCDSENCNNNKIHIFECKTCNLISQTCNSTDNINPAVSCEFVAFCGSIYCSRHFQNNSLRCQSCLKYYCDECGYDAGKQCSNYKCLKFFCNHCCANVPGYDEEKLFYCDECGASLFNANADVQIL